MAKKQTGSGWPPRNGRDYIYSDQFGDLLVAQAREMAAVNPTLDFSDAVASVFSWFDSKLQNDKNFINQKRFPSNNSFRYYLRRALLNAARMTRRQRDRRREIHALDAARPIAREPLSYEELDDLFDRVQQLDFPYKEVLERLFFEKEGIDSVASSLGMDVKTTQEVYEEALDML